MLGCQGDEFFHQFFVPAFDVELVDDIADSARGPEFGHERVCVIITFGNKVGGEVERLFFVADFARQFHFGFAVSVVAADHHDLIAGEKVELAFGVEPIHGGCSV